LVYQLATWHSSEQLVHDSVGLRAPGTSPDNLVQHRLLRTSLGPSLPTWYISTPLATYQTTWYITLYNQLVHHFVHLRPLGTSPGYLVQNSEHLVHHLVYLRPRVLLCVCVCQLLECVHVSVHLHTTWYISDHWVYHLVQPVGTSLRSSQATWYIMWPLGAAQSSWYITWHISGHLVRL